MIPLIVLLCASLAALGLLAAGWWGSNVIVHPPKMIPLEDRPERHGLAYESVAFRTSDGLTLKGWLVPAAAPTPRTVLLCHGWGDNKGAILEPTRALAARFNLFYFDFRQHGESEGKLSTIGYLEARDADAALDFLARARPEWASRLGIYGLSMGAAVALRAAALRPEIRAAVIEAPFLSFNAVVRQWTWNSMHLPYFPFAWVTLLVLRWRLGGDPEPYSPAYHAASVAPKPALFIAGGEDTLMPPEVVRALYERAGRPKEFWLVEGATHAKCAERAGPEYQRRLAAFFEEHL